MLGELVALERVGDHPVILENTKETAPIGSCLGGGEITPDPNFGAEVSPEREIITDRPNHNSAVIAADSGARALDDPKSGPEILPAAENMTGAENHDPPSCTCCGPEGHLPFWRRPGIAHREVKPDKDDAPPSPGEE